MFDLSSDVLFNTQKCKTTWGLWGLGCWVSKSAGTDRVDRGLEMRKLWKVSMLVDDSVIFPTW